MRPELCRPGRLSALVNAADGRAAHSQITDNLSDEEVCTKFVENPYYQYFCGEEFFRHDLPLGRSSTSMTRWRQRMGEDKIEALLQESLNVAVRLWRGQACGLHPRDCRYHGGREEYCLSHRCQTDPQGAGQFGQAGQGAWHQAAPVLQRVGKLALIMQQRYAHATQYKRARKQLKRLRIQTQ